MSIFAAATRKASLLRPCCRRSVPKNNLNNSLNNLTLIQVRWMHPEQRLIEKRKIALAAAHAQVTELEAKATQAAEQQAAAAAAARPLQVAAAAANAAKMKTSITNIQVSTSSSSCSSSALPKPKTNDGTSSGAVAERRLREKRQAILEKMMQESSSKE
jgi:hypothetical protein